MSMLLYNEHRRVDGDCSLLSEDSTEEKRPLNSGALSTELEQAKASVHGWRLMTTLLFGI